MLLWLCLYKHNLQSFPCPSFPCQVPDVINLHLLQPPSISARNRKPSPGQSVLWLPAGSEMAQWEHPTELCSTASCTPRALPSPATAWHFLHWAHIHPVIGFLHQKFRIFQLLRMFGVGVFPLALELHCEECGFEARINARSVKHLCDSHKVESVTALQVTQTLRDKVCFYWEGAIHSHYPC